MIKIEDGKFIYPVHKVILQRAYFVSTLIGKKKKTVLCCGFCHRPIHVMRWGSSVIWRHNPR